MGVGDAFEEPFRRIDDVISTGRSWSGSLGNVWDSFGEQLDEFSKSWMFDSREPVSGSAIAVHPNMFLGLTSLRFIGVSRLPVLGSKLGLLGVKYVPKVWTKGRHLGKNLKSTGSSVSGKIKNPLPKTTKAVKDSKHVKKVIEKGAIAVAGSVIASGLASVTNGRSKLNKGAEGFYYGKKKVNREKWV